MITRIKTETTNIFKLTSKDIVGMLLQEKIVARYNNIKVEFQVPGGADWSGMLLDINEDNPIIVTVTYVDEK